MTTLIAGKYEMLESLGDSAAGAVYKVRHPLLESVLTVTVPSERVTADAGRLAMFQAAVRRTCEVRHDHIVPVLDLVEEAGRYHVVEGSVDAESLEHVLAESGPLPPGDALLIARQLTEALGHAHTQGVVHGALTPANVLVARSTPPRAFVSGFAAAALAPESRPVGAYTAPERLRGGAPDARVDVFGVGLLLFEMLEGRPLLVGSPEEVERVLLDSSAPLLPRFSRIVPSGVPALVARAVRRGPGYRQQNMAQLRDEIDACLRRLGERRATEARRRPLLVIDTLSDDEPAESPAEPSEPAAASMNGGADTEPARRMPAPRSRRVTVTPGTRPTAAPKMPIAAVVGIGVLALGWALVSHLLAPRSHEIERPAAEQTAKNVAAPAAEAPTRQAAGEPVAAPSEAAPVIAAAEPSRPEPAPRLAAHRPEGRTPERRAEPARNVAPRVVARRPPGRGAIRVMEGRATAFAVRAADRNAGDHLKYAWFVDGRRVSGEPRFRFVAPAAAAGAHSIQVRVSDRAGLEAPRVSWMVEVTPRMSERDVRDWLSRLTAAWERKDVAMLRLYGIVTGDAEADGVRRRLARYDGYRVAISNPTIRTDGQYASVAFNRIDFDGRGTFLGSHREVYRLAKQPNGFVGLQAE